MIKPEFLLTLRFKQWKESQKDIIQYKKEGIKRINLVLNNRIKELKAKIEEEKKSALEARNKVKQEIIRLKQDPKQLYDEYLKKQTEFAEKDNLKIKWM